ncbi:hypothetical protein [Streptomyces sp. NPDC059009]|uniref:hypothetical protein n=1 Tax=Streptomyces sp. NPDC059009 TaxID=3346694 RepID=UPI0036A597A7
MKARTKHGMVAALSAVAVLGGTATEVFAADAATVTKQTVTQQATAQQSDPAATPAAYVTYLRHSHEEGAADTLKKFKNLTRVQQHKYLGYLHDPALFKAFLDKGTAAQGKGISVHSQNASSTTSLRGGDVTMGQERTFSGLDAAAKKRKKPLPRGAHSVKYNAYVKYFGIKAIRLTLKVNFHSNGRDIDKMYKAEATKRNLSGVISLDHKKTKQWRSKWMWCPVGKPCSNGHNANASVIWEGSVVMKGSTFQLDKKQKAQGNIYGRLSNYSLKNV